MARHAGAHIVHHLFGDHIALANRSVAGLAGGAGLDVHAVAEVDERRDLVDADPGNRLLLLGRDSYLLNIGTVSPYGLVATHAETLCRKPHEFAGISVSVAGSAFQS